MVFSKLATKKAKKLAAFDQEELIDKLQKKKIEERKKQLIKLKEKDKKEKIEKLVSEKDKEELKKEEKVKDDSKENTRYDQQVSDKYDALDGFLLNNQKSSNIFEDPREPDFEVEFKTNIEQKPLKNEKLGSIFSKMNKNYNKNIKEELSMVDRNQLNF
mmetsp:Transcript_21297/g.18906  ORF Transcript_21297/g.18906 Transcript_21297/m.18906 type:complete len:159 (+) Transcript_21297:338-814(+)